MSTDAHVIYLKPTGPFHLQTGGEDHETIDAFPRADTVSAALSYLWFRQYGELPGYPEALPFQVSSLLPAVCPLDAEHKSPVRLYPKPTGIDINPEQIDHKVFKSVNWLDPVVFEKWRRGGLSERDLPTHSTDQRLQCDGKVLCAEGSELGSEAMYKMQSRTRVVLDRVTQASVPFHFASVQYAPRFRFALHFTVAEAHRNRFLALLRLLGDEGLGADRTIGMGSFEVEESIETISFDRAPEYRHWLNIGIFNPGLNTSSIDWEDSSYKLGQRSGWVSGTSLRRASVPVIEEASVLSSAEMPVGAMPMVLDKDSENIPADNKIDYSIYRDCRGFFIPCRI